MTIQRSIPFEYLLLLLVWGHHGPLISSGVFVAEKLDGAGDKGSGDTRATDVQTLLEAILKMYCHNDEAFSLIKNKASNLEIIILRC
jgi:hypothetical protein